MSAINQAVTTVPVHSEEEQHKREQKHKWSVTLAGRNVPYWLILLVVILFVVVGCWYTGKCRKEKVTFAGPTGLTGDTPFMMSSTPLMSATSTTVGSVGSQQVREQLRALFEQF